MRNSGRHAFGIGVQWEIGTGDRVAVKPRYRRWLSSSVALDVAPGIVVWDDRIANSATGAFSARSPGFTGHVGLSYKI